jgi:hypothetical protein
VERELLGLIGEQRELLFINWTLQQLDKEGKRVCLINRVKWPAGKLAIQKVFFFLNFVVFVTFSPLSIYCFHFCGKEVSQSSVSCL